MVWNENRDFGAEYAFQVRFSRGVHPVSPKAPLVDFRTVQMHDMAKRDRNHPSVVVNSLCNEYECLNSAGVGAAYVAASKAVDPSRPTTANSDKDDGLGAVIDVQVRRESSCNLAFLPLHEVSCVPLRPTQGHSHASNSTFNQGHAANPAQPLVLSECCSCESSRVPRAPVDASCISSENSPMFLPYVTGSLGVWTLFDYFGEPPG